MLFPKKMKFRKRFTDRKHPDKDARPETRGITLAFGSYGLKATSHARITSNQIEAARKVIARYSAKNGKMWTRIFPDRPFTQKPAEVKMGKGKGDPVGFVFPVKAGRVMFEVDGISEADAREALRKAGTKLPVTSRVVSRQIA